MEERKNIKTKKYRIIILSSVALLILLWIFAIKYFNGYFNSSVNSNWQQIKSEKIDYQNKICLTIYEKYFNELSGVSKNLADNLDIRTSLSNGEQKRTFDILLKQNLPSAINAEIYNKRIETTAYTGRHINPDFLLLQKALKGKESYLLKEIGFYTYLIIFTPVKDISDESLFTGVLVCAYQLDLMTQVKNDYFKPAGLSYEIRNVLDIGTEIIPNNSISYYKVTDSLNTDLFRFIDLTSPEGTILGKLKIPNYERGSHLHSMLEYSDKIISILVFLFTLIIAVLLIILFRNVSKNSVKIILIFFYLGVTRYLWVLSDFPNKILNLEIFSPSYYAISYSFGMLKSLGDLFITSIFILIICVFAALRIQAGIGKNNISYRKTGYLNTFSNVIFYFLVSFVVTYIYGFAIHTIVYDSNIKFHEITEIVPSLELFLIQLTILIITFSYLLILTSFFLQIYLQSKYIIPFTILRRIRILFVFAVFFIISILLSNSIIDFVILHFQRVIIFLVVLIFCLYINRLVYKTRNPAYLNIKTLLYLFLICIFIIPYILLDNLRKKEVKYIELIGKELIQPSEDKSVFVIADELEKNSLNKDLYENLRKNNKLPELSFSIWANSKLVNENYNSAVFIIDTNENIISDFNLNPSQIKEDTVVNFVKRKYFNVDYDYTTPDSEIDTATGLDILTDEPLFNEEEDIYLPSIYDNVDILHHSNENLLIGIVSIENIDLKNTQFEKNYGYLLIVVNYSFNNLFSQSSHAVFQAKSRNNLFDKLFSEPSISEFENREIVNSTKPEISKVNLKTLETSGDITSPKYEKGIWLYETNNEDKYKTFYISASDINRKPDSDENERIFAISIKRNDFTITLLYYFKFIIFSAFIFLVLYLFYSLRLIFKLKHIEFFFREKLFVSFLLVSVLPIIFLAVYTRTYVKNKNEVNLQNQILSDLNLVNESIKGKKINFFNFKNQDSILKIQKKILDKSLAKPDKNFNLFLREKLISTTNEELYKSDLLDTRLDAEAYYNLFLLKKDLFLKENYIGNNTFLTGFKPVKDKDNNLIGILSSQSLFKQSEINRELTENLTYIFGSYISAIIILIILVNVFADRLSKPILELKAATEKLSKGQTNFEIRIQRNDEIGSLVNSFNKMTKQITRSKAELKKAEREAAWRDIARRVAHEIKNPLTPMKLAIQHLFEIHKNRKNEDFDNVITKTKDMIINEIDKLNKIATDFSNFAKLPGRNYENLKINDIIKEVVSLYQTDPKVEFRMQLEEFSDPIHADRQELNRVFQNLIKNAIQSIEKNGIVEIISLKTKNDIYIEIKDNGCGMLPEVMKNLFTPNFSTKSSGMGLGLAIVKKSLDDMGAEISYDSNIDFGTTVKLKFKISENH